MTPPEQLLLDFSTPIAESRPVSRDCADVIQLQPLRQAREAQRMQGVYDAIVATISHIRLDRARSLDGDR